MTIPRACFPLMPKTGKHRNWVRTKLAPCFSLAIVLLVYAGAAMGQSLQETRASSENDPSSPAIHGQGSANYVAKFLDAHTIANSAISESGGNIFTRESITAGAIWG